MNRWVLLEHKVYLANSVDIHYDFLVENGIDCLTWKFLKLPLLNQASIEITSSQIIDLYGYQGKNTCFLIIEGL